MRVFNFSPGPAVLPEPVLRKAAAEMLDWHGSGMSVMEMSHRGPEFMGIAEKAEGRSAHAAGDPGELPACCSCRAARSRRTRSSR